MIAKTLFKAYDIRGVVDDNLTEQAAQLIGHAIGTRAAQLKIPSMVVGRDGRLSGERLQAALIHGIICAGVDVIDLGMVPTPLVYFATRHLNLGSGIVVTGSHNPPQYNGIKIMLAGDALHGEQITHLYELITTQQLTHSPHQGRVSTYDITSAYLEAISNDIHLARPMHVAIDCGNGVGGVIASTLFKRLGCTVTELFCEVNGQFPNHHPDPAEPTNLVDLQNALRQGSAEIGLAFDGDADRLGVVAADGNIIYPDRLMMLFAQELLAQQPNATIIIDGKASAHLPRLITRLGGQALFWKTGHSLMKAKLKETAAPLAGETNGHFYFNDRWAGLDDGFYAAARLLSIASRMSNITDTLNALPQSHTTPELTIPVSEGEGHEIVAHLQQQTASLNCTTLSTIDGIRADYHDGFGLIRASNTTPALVLRFEGDTPMALLRIQNEFKHWVLSIRPTLNWPLK